MTLAFVACGACSPAPSDVDAPLDGGLDASSVADAGLDAPRGCRSASDCSEPTPICAPERSVCVGCRDDGDCALGERCGASTSACEPTPCSGASTCPSGTSCSPAGSCAVEECSAPAHRCVGDQSQACEGGFWQLPMACPDRPCDAGTGVCPTPLACSPGTARCSADMGGVETCAADGSGWVESRCGFPANCNPTLLRCDCSTTAPVCRFDIDGCSPVLYGCDASGLNWVIVDNCTARGLRCSEGACGTGGCYPTGMTCSCDGQCCSGSCIRRPFPMPGFGCS